MEWTWQQQILFLLRSIGLGVVQGLVLDVITGCVRSLRGMRWLWTDIVFGPLAAIITFFGALVVMDGQLHPLLIFGVFLGMAIEHMSVGAWICRSIRRVRCEVRRTFRILCGFAWRIGCVVANQMKGICCCWAKRSRKGEK